MYCLFNGEYGEHDLSHIKGIDGILKNQKESYPKWAGTIVGDFTVVKVEYDWGKGSQRWSIRCTHCGEESYIYNATDWRRGKGRSTKCHCQKPPKKKKEPKPKPDYENPNNIGKIVGDHRILEYIEKNKYRVECLVCGKRRTLSCRSVLNNKIDICNHIIPNNYSDPKWIGQKNGHLTALYFEKNRFVAKCDCGKTISVRGTYLFNCKSATYCGSSECPYSNVDHPERIKVRTDGLEFEHNIAETLKKYGYEIEHTPDTGDYGVDIIMKVEKRKIAIQCKKTKSPSGLKAIQEVFSGGIFYDCNSFMVVSPSGFTINAIKFASKLGVLLVKDSFQIEDFDNITNHCENMIKTLPIVKRNRKYEKEMWEIDGVTKAAEDWCGEIGVSRETVKNRLKKGMTLKEALYKKRSPIVTVFGITGTLREVSKHFGFLPETVRYRMKYRGMSLEEALTAPKNQLQ